MHVGKSERIITPECGLVNEKKRGGQEKNIRDELI